MVEYPHVGLDANGIAYVVSGRLRYSVWNVANLYINKRRTIESIASDLGIELAAATSALAFYFDNMAPREGVLLGSDPLLSGEAAIVKDFTPKEQGIYWARSYKHKTYYDLIVIVLGTAPFLRIFPIVWFDTAKWDGIQSNIVWGPKIDQPEVGKESIAPIVHQTTE